jgi:RNA polymerase sigma-70 factor (ECF subfamily)
VERIVRGDRAAAERFVREYSPCVQRLLLYLTGHAPDAEDLTQETFLKAWQALPRFRGEASLSTWLRRIAYHEYRSWQRARKEHVWIEAVAEVPGLADQPEERLLLAEALGTLSPEHRDTFLLHHVEGLTLKEVAEVLQIPTGTVMSRLFSARQQLRRRLSAEENRDDVPRACKSPGECGPLSAIEPKHGPC